MLGEYFARCSGPEDFAEAVRGLKGGFILDAAEMIGLGEAYFSRHPESDQRLTPHPS
jgi:hypothetical protein